MPKLQNDPVIVSYARTPFGKYGGIFKNTRPDDLLVYAIQSCIKKSKIDKSLIDEVVIGAANQAGEDNRNIARMAALLSGLDVQIPAITVNRLCSSGLDAIIEGARRIICGDHKAVLVGGVESMTRAPYVMAKQNKAFAFGAPKVFDTALGWRFYNNNFRNITPPESNGETVERLAALFGISRKDQDEYAFNSHKRACSAIELEFFKNEIEPIENFTCDEGPRANISLEALNSLKPAFVENGTLTAGNSSPLSDGAAALLVCSHEFAKKESLPILARILGYETCGVDPKSMGLGPIPATEKLCKRYGFSLKDFNLFEINEAFAAQVLCVARELNLDLGLLNINGGAIAIGHPLGSSGARLVMTMLNSLRAKNLSLGLVSLCVGVGQGASIALEAY